MTPDETKLRSAIIQAATDFLTAGNSIDTEQGTITNLPTMPAKNIAWENKKFESPEKSVWANVSLIPATSGGRTIGKGGFDEDTSILQIDINTPSEKGEADMIPWQSKLRVFFHGGRTFTYEGYSVLVKSSSISQGRTFHSYYRKSISVNFSSYLKRHQTT